mmetsp:Transcript_8966/g.18059  ORF Transcript_8966/g.18059 Transcript_8966/m.18059 type:complete len:98 (-) Transcript_8966:395-688(-)
MFRIWELVMMDELSITIEMLRGGQEMIVHACVCRYRCVHVDRNYQKGILPWQMMIFVIDEKGKKKSPALLKCVVVVDIGVYCVSVLEKVSWCATLGT